VVLVVAAQEALEVLHEEASLEVGAGERREDVVDLEIVEGEHHEVEVAFQAAAELREVVALAEGEARLYGLCELSGLRIVQDTGQKWPDKHEEASWRYRYPSTRTEDCSTRWKTIASAKSCAIYHSTDTCESPRTCCHAWVVQAFLLLAEIALALPRVRSPAAK
jgi:hypothetical protein